MKTYGLSDDPSQMEQGKISKAACVSLWVGFFFFLPLLSTEVTQSCSFLQTRSNMQRQKQVRFLKFKLNAFMPAEDWPIYLHFISPHFFGFFKPTI